MTFPTNVVIRDFSISSGSIMLFQNNSLCNHFLMMISLEDYCSLTNAQKKTRKNRGGKKRVKLPVL